MPMSMRMPVLPCSAKFSSTTFMSPKQLATLRSPRVTALLPSPLERGCSVRAALRSCWMLALSFITLTAHAVDPDTPLERLSRQTWGIQEGVPPFSTHPTITTNGYLWLASGTGVHRFDGV